MIRLKKIALIAFMAVALAGTGYTASAGENYFGIQYAMTTYSETGLNKDIKPNAIVGKIGKYTSDNFAIEGRIGFGVSEDSTRINGTAVDLEVGSVMGVYGVGHMPISSSTSVYGMLGISRVEVKANARYYGSRVSASNDETDLSFGIGADIEISGNTKLNIEYISYADKTTLGLSALSVGLKLDY